MSEQRQDIDLNDFRQKLLDMQQALEDQDQKTREDRAPVELDQTTVGRLSRMDAMQVQAMALATGQRRQQMGKRIIAALQRLDEGDYGYCTLCDDEIPVKRLQLDPTAATCVACAQAHEK